MAAAVNGQDGMLDGEVTLIFLSECLKLFFLVAGSLLLATSRLACYF